MTISELKIKLSKSLDFLESELTQIRTSRAAPSLLENISVEAYGSTMTLKELGSITALDSQNLLVSPWDKSLLGAIDKAIRENSLGLNPIVNSDSVRVPIPQLTEERRKEFARLVSTRVEETKSSMRGIRQEAMKDVDKVFADKLIGEDDKFRDKEEIEKVVKDFVAKADTAGDLKTRDVMVV